MGGRFGDGAIPEKDDAVVFHSEWEARALALNLAAGALGQWNIDMSRHARERLAPKDYANFSYYEKWISGLTDLFVSSGVLSVEDIERAALLAVGDTEARPAELSDKALKAEAVWAGMHAVKPYSREGGAAAFAVGDRVRTATYSHNKNVAGGHTRLPSYAAGRVGTVVMLHGAHVFPDSNAHGLGEAPEPLYAVEFSAADLWEGDAESAADSMVLDLWQSYLSAEV
nr:nitrile hydratase subunit beta [Lentibacter algarum]